jgi:hypothetical protein
MTTDPVRDAFERLAPRPVDPQAARAEFVSLAPGFRQARLRHRIRVGASGAVFALALVAGVPAVLAAVGSGPTEVPDDFASDTDEPATDIANAAEDGVEGTVDDSLEDGEPDDSSGSSDTDTDGDDIDGLDSTPAEPSTSGEDHPGDDVGSEAPSSPGPGDETDPPSLDDPDDPDDPDDSDDSDDPDDSDDAGVPAVNGMEVTRTSPGGSVRIKVVDGALQIDSVEPADGFTHEVTEEKPNKVEVKFRAGSEEYEVEFELEDGILKPEITEQDPES